MKRSTLAAATVVALAAVGLCSPAALAAPSGHGHGPSTHGSSTHGDHKLANAQKQVRQQIKVRDAKLDRVLATSATKLGTDDAAAVAANITADQTALATLGDELAAATTSDEVSAIAVQVRAFRVETYRQAVSGLAHVARTDTTDPDVAAAAAAASDLLRGLTATSTKAERKAALDAIAALDELLEPTGTDETGTDTTDGTADESGSTADTTTGTPAV